MQVIRIDENRLRELILEELGIANGVTEVTNKLYREILVIAEQNLEFSYQVDFDGYHIDAQYGYFDTEAFNIPTTVWVTVYFFPSQNLYDAFIEQHKDELISGGSWRDDFGDANNGTTKDYISVSLASINGRLVTDGLMQTIQHEISHLYEQYRAHHGYRNYPGYKNSLSIMPNTQYGDIDRAVACIIYYSGKGEYVAFENGLYQELVRLSNDKDDIRNIDIKNTYMYRRKMEAENALQTVENEGDTERVKNALNQIGSNLDYSELVKIGEQNIKNLNRCIRRGWAKFHKDANLI